jgi:hypothetical protein
MTETAPHQWELYKENAAPLERGRNIDSLSKALAPSSSTSGESLSRRKEGDSSIHKFESLVKGTERFANAYLDRLDEEGGATLSDDVIQKLMTRYRVENKIDPIVHWLRYIKYHEETYITDTHAQFLLMERCTQALLHHPKYQNDVRYVRVCVLYADKTSVPHEQFKFFHKHKIGSTTAIFWLAWAWVAEKRKDYPFCEKIFKKALAKKAKPGKVVEQRYKQFQRRMSRFWLNANSSPEDNENSEEDEGTNHRRGALSGLTEEGVRQNHRGREVNSMALGTNNSRQQQQQQQQQQQAGNLKNGVREKSGFAIFAEEDKENGLGGYNLNQSIAEGHKEHLQRFVAPRMTTERDRLKENSLAAEEWNKRGGLNAPQHGTRVVEEEEDRMNREQYESTSSVAQRWAGDGSTSLVAGGTSAQPAFQVFVDEDCDKKENQVEENEASHKTKHTKPDRSLRQRMEGDLVSYCIGRIQFLIILY